jgi:hypothetical protein
MTPRERILAAFRRQEVDHVPCAPFMNFQDWSQRIGKRWQYPFGPSLPETLEYMARTMGVDQVVPFGWGFFPEPGVSARAWISDDTIHKSWDTPSGRLHAAVRYEPLWPHGLDIPFYSDYNPAHFIEPWLKGEADVACLKHILLPPRSRDDLELLRFQHREARHWADRYGVPLMWNSGLGLTGGLQMFGPMELCLLAASEPSVVEEYVRIDHELNMRNTEIAMELGVDLVRRNGFYESTDFYGPPMLERFLARSLREEIEAVHAAGRPIGYTLLTGITPQLSHLAALDFDCIICPDLFMPGADGERFQAVLGGRKSFWTGPSDTIHMPWERPADVRQAVRRVFEVFGKTGLLITPCSSSKAVFPWENMVAMVDEWKKLR